MWLFGRSVYIMEYYAPYRVARQFDLVQDIVGDIPLYPRMTREERYWGPTVSPLEGKSSFQMAPYLVWDEWLRVGEDPRTTGGYRSWWEGHFLVHLTIPGILEDDELQPTIDEVVGREDDGPNERVVVVAGRGAGRQQRRVRVVWRREPEVG